MRRLLPKGRISGCEPHNRISLQCSNSLSSLLTCFFLAAYKVFQRCTLETLALTSVLPETDITFDSCFVY